MSSTNSLTRSSATSSNSTSTESRVFRPDRSRTAPEASTWGRPIAEAVGDGDHRRRHARARGSLRARPTARDPRLDGASRAAGGPGARNRVMAEKRSALVVATSEYEDARLAPLGGPGRDAE